MLFAGQAMAAKDLAQCHAWKGELAAQYERIKHLADVDFPKHTGLSRLEYTAMLGTPQQLIEGLKATPPEAQPRIIQKLLVSSAWYGRLDNVRFLVSQGADVNYTDGTISPPLPVAAHCGGPAVVRFLIANHANAYVRLPNAADAMRAALSSNDIGTVEVLLESGYDPCLAAEQPGKSTTAEVASRLGHPGLVGRLSCTRPQYPENRSRPARCSCIGLQSPIQASFRIRSENSSTCSGDKHPSLPNCSKC
jgi:ankyrin repeat protein